MLTHATRSDPRLRIHHVRFDATPKLLVKIICSKPGGNARGRLVMTSNFDFKKTRKTISVIVVKSVVGRCHRSKLNGSGISFS